MSVQASVPSMVLALAAGAVLGVFFCMHLKAQVRRIADAGGYTLSNVAGYFLRIGFVVAGLLIVMNGRWERLAAALVGFIVARELFVRAAGPARFAHGRGSAWKS